MNRLELMIAAALLLIMAKVSYAGSLNPPYMEPEVTPPSQFVQCPPRFGKNKWVKRGHEEALCRETPKPAPERPEPKPPVECSSLDGWQVGRAYANGKPPVEKKCG